jgi:hypothetical protein
MKAVIYHADDLRAERYGFNYEKLISGMKENLNSYGIELIYLTLEGCPGYGDVNYFYSNLIPGEITYNREVCFTDFLKNKAEDNEQYWFSEADVRLRNPFPLLEENIDAAFVVNTLEKRFIPPWRLAKKSAAKIFAQALSYYTTLKGWDGDTESWGQLYREMGHPEVGTVISYNDLQIESRPYKPYNMSSSYYAAHYKGKNKQFLLERNDLFINPEYKK